jgi:hypothetical protein
VEFAAYAITTNAAREIIATGDGVESPYAFQGLEQLLADFWQDLNERR